MANSALYIPALLISLGAGLGLGMLRSGNEKRAFVWPVTTLAMTATVAIAFAAQLKFPELLTHYARDPAIVHNGEIWRLATALFFQDSGVAGAIFNLIVLVLLGAVAEQRFKPFGWLTIYLGGGILTECAALILQPHGAGNSIACFALAGALCMYGVFKPEGAMRTFARFLGLGAALALCLMRDIHGVGFLIGAVLGVFVVKTQRV